MSALGGILRKHWGAVGRDLIVAGYTWADVGTARLPVDQFIAFVTHAPPGTAVYHERHQGWTVADHLLTDLLEVTDWIAWTKTVDAQQKTHRKKPKPRQRPGSTAKAGPKQAAEDQPMTVADYVAKTGMVINLEGRE